VVEGEEDSVVEDEKDSVVEGEKDSVVEGEKDSGVEGEKDSGVENTASLKGDQWTISAPTAWDTSSLAGLMAVLREDRVALDTSPLAPGYIAIAVHRFGEWIGSDGFPRVLRRPAAILHRFMAGYVRSFLGFEIDKSVCLGRRVRFHHQHGVVIDGACVIGDDCVFHHNVTLAARHRVDSPTSLYHAPQIGSTVRLGAGCIVLGGVRIGDGATIGPNAVVTSDVPPGASVIAPPARILRIR
jgi:serine O-acetyltransferase